MLIRKQFAVTDPLSAAAHDFAVNLAQMYDDDHIEDVFISEASLRSEVTWWHGNCVEQAGSEDDDDDDVFTHADLDSEEIADTAVKLYKGWKWRDAAEYGESIMVEDPDSGPDLQVQKAFRPRKLRKGELEISTVIDE